MGETENPYQSPATRETADRSQPATKRPQLSAKELDRIRWEIKKQSDNAVVCGVLGYVMFFTIPLAFICGKRAIQLIERHNVGRDHLARANLGMSLARIALAILIAIPLLFVVSASLSMVW